MIPSNFRKLTPVQRRDALKALYLIDDDELQLLANQTDLTELSDILVESSIGTFPIPLGIATGFLVDRCLKFIPMATEEPSVIAAASYAAHLIKAGEGFTTWADSPVMTTQIFLKEAKHLSLQTCKEKIGSHVNAIIPRMVQRGGGFRGVSTERKEDTLLVSIDVDVCDAMGANVMNTVAEGMKDYLSNLFEGRVLMSILTNASSKRKAGASFKVPVKLFRKGGLSGLEACQRIVEANQTAQLFPERAVTHNKGVMNGISALALATGNDTRAIESAAHFYAQKTGQYLPLTTYEISDNSLKGNIELPLALGTVGGTTSFWPASRFALKLLSCPDAQSLNKLAAALGLAQNLAALFALVSDGIQGGHMKLHAAKAAYAAGARGESIRQIGETLWNERKLDIEEAKKVLEKTTS
ncbi:3-hydroxy-3-methylglutaryl-coenzyme A reductase [Waddlia chondrophila 2032/99]|uniref:3-hydroxy-3-methylglutaryl coenzyme A reductase n=2 Tax=Waddlia chondrophila TaxID=71667 RepID=D6YWG3_WADCW|nr:hydroxymethylglutaryl-CoA reductase, degradative [Waddlia chondrophila]ADI38474.1 putative Hydroxymethylglutaryl-CoA reductase [Waddlia chondrophila WSU 86-1044]CCB91556.1 3-hydroxy-3-methylglutaryl-coenzyme A reductase [Waddlia chondrophila 2032/99]